MVDKSASEASRTQQPMQDGQESYLRGQLEELRSQLLRAQEHMVELNAELCNRKEEAVERMRAAERASVSSGVGGREHGPAWIRFVFRVHRLIIYPSPPLPIHHQ